jgi:Tetratricopeptide repeat/Cytochrome c554 and c-prime
MQARPAALLVLLAGSGFAADYVGSKACAKCHAPLYRAYLRTPMGRSLVDARERPELASTRTVVVSEELHRQFEVWTDRGKLYQSEAGAGFRQEFPVAYAIGSGANGIGFIVRRGDYLFEAPLSYYRHAHAWGLSPGYENVDSGFNRPIASGCISCHSGRAQPIPNTNGKYLEPALLEPSVGCENCHGPGARHVAAGGARAAIVNPARLTPDLMQDICMYCHQAGDIRVLQPGKTLLDFRPGAPLDDTVAIFKMERQPSTADLLEHHESMRLSRCFRESGRMTCLTCHDPHAGSIEYRAKCLSCHDKPLPSPHPARKSDCIGCHMPKRAVATIAHSTLTNHRIVRNVNDLPPLQTNAATDEMSGLVHVNATPGRPLPLITLLQAYGQLIDQRPEYARKFNELLDRTSQENGDDPLVLAMLGRSALRSNSIDDAIRYLTHSIERGSIAPGVFEDLGEALARAGRPADALSALQRGIQLAPFAPELYKSAALQYVALGQRDEAVRTLNFYLGLFPQDDFIRQLLERLPRRK